MEKSSFADVRDKPRSSGTVNCVSSRGNEMALELLYRSERAYRK